MVVTAKTNSLVEAMGGLTLGIPVMTTVEFLHPLRGEDRMCPDGMMTDARSVTRGGL